MIVRDKGVFMGFFLGVGYWGLGVRY